MVPPFSTDQFLQVFIAYNTAVWPVQVLLVVAAVSCLVFAFRPEPWADKAAVSILAGLWAWMAVAYHWAFFAEINPAARIFAVFFLLEAVLLLQAGFRTGSLRFQPRRDLFGVTGAVLIAYALIIYPMVGIALGHRYPAQPTFGLPCPTTIFTVGMLLWVRPRVPWGPLLVPLGWSVIGATAVIHFGMMEDALLPVATVTAVILVFIKNRRGRTGPA